MALILKYLFTQFPSVSCKCAFKVVVEANIEFPLHSKGSVIFK